MIYYVEDDKDIRELVIYTLGITGFETKGFENGNDFFLALEENRPSLIMLDIMLPDTSGLEILEKLKKIDAYTQIPVIMLTAKGSEFDKVTGLDMGADDYLAKPFGMMELVSRVKAVLRRSNITSKPQTLSIADLTMNLDKHTIFIGEEEIHLTLKEYDLLKILLENKGTVYSRDTLFEKVWGYNYAGETRTLDVHILSLRNKLGESGKLIETVRGVGYKISG